MTDYKSMQKRMEAQGATFAQQMMAVIEAKDRYIRALETRIDAKDRYIRALENRIDALTKELEELKVCGWPPGVR